MNTPDWKLALDVLMDGKPHHTLDIMAICKPGSRNWALRSRVSNIRKKGYTIINLNRHYDSIYKKSPDDKEAVYQLMEKPEDVKNHAEMPVLTGQNKPVCECTRKPAQKPIVSNYSAPAGACKGVQTTLF